MVKMYDTAGKECLMLKEKMPKNVNKRSAFIKDEKLYKILIFGKMIFKKFILQYMQNKTFMLEFL